MDEARCCVCRQAIPAGEGRRLGRREFCALHHERALRATHAHLSRAGLIEVALVALFVAAVAVTLGRGAQAALPTSMATGLLLALVPSAIWLVYIHRQDRLEPEPWGLVLGVFVLGGLLGHALSRPVAEQLFGVAAWRHRSPFAEWVASIAVVATLEQLCKYLAVRYTVYLTDEFDEPVDGVVYATAAGLGLATALNVHRVVSGHGVLPLAGAALLASTALVQVASGALLGYGLGQARFDPRAGGGRLALVFVASVLVDGLLTHLALSAGVDGATFRPWASLGAALGMTTAVLISAHLLTARLRRQTLAAEVSLAGAA